MLEALDKHKAERHAINGMNPFGPNNSFGKHRNEVRIRSHSHTDARTHSRQEEDYVIPKMTCWGETKMCIAKETSVSLLILLLSLPLLRLFFFFLFLQLVGFYSCGILPLLPSFK